jgi:hypothetical protein
MKIEVDDDYGFLLKEVFSGIGLESPSGETFGICMRDSGFEIRYNNIWYEAKDGYINRIPPPSVAEKKSLRDYQENLSPAEVKNNEIIVEGLNAASEFKEEIRPFMSTAIPEKDEEVRGFALDGKFHEIESIEEIPEAEEFDTDKVYTHRDCVKWGDCIWRFIGENYRAYPGHGYASFNYTQMRSIGMYPSKKFGWRKI